ncbi:MAG: chemotaxis protein CheR [Firmicutes bacterium HGW-Firmicutes-2]|jgi:two-component system CheB/CheR fusion protein|nr:MAG: chemotaxis protein CheR [Firmicutes bacterium HGW-Firmicutes-2]
MGTKEKEEQNFSVVGIGASAGGLAAFEAFFTGMPKDVEPNMTFVLIQHLAPDHKSILTEIIERYTNLPVFEVEDGMIIKPNCIYIIPPNKNMALINGSLQLLDFTSPRGQNMPIDYFFRSLATDQKERAVCIVLSGTGSDGTLGLRAIKDEGGIAIAQSTESAEYNGMPSSAIATGLVDYQLAPDEMVKNLISYVSHASRIADHPVDTLESNNENLLKKIFLLIRNQKGHDFSKYKPSMINRRIERRLAVNQIENMADYIKFLQQTPAEIEVLLNDMLIGVTSFFRDKDAFEKLEKEIIPKLFEGKPENSTVRIWCAGCSTGEEAYSIAILLREHLEELKMRYNVQIFATDIDRQAIAIARSGIYSSSVIEELSSERIEKFFILEPGNSSYRISKSIREMLIFSEQSIIKDPPFSRLDLISCRNLMIYLSSELQKKLIPLFHYALSPNGILFLGVSETVGNFEMLFEVVDRKLKFYRRKEDAQGIQRSIPSQILEAPVNKEEVDSLVGVKTDFRPKPTLREITEQAILKDNSVSGILVNDNGDTLYIHGRTGMYLEPSQGEVGVSNILKMAREGLRRELKNALKNCIEKNETVRIQEINVRTNGHFTKVNLTVKPVRIGTISTKKRTLYIILLEEAKEQAINRKVEVNEAHPTVESDAYIEELKSELRLKDEYLQAANEELETSNEELKSSVEEMQSVNEELQSTNEELETSKEELQSINEELTTVNSELQVKVHDLSQVSNDMNNLLSGTNIATIFLDHQQNILRFTPTANKIINLISSDIGRPVTHIASNLVEYNQLTVDVKTVLDTLILKNIEVQTLDGNWYEMIIQPYRTIENVIEGVVLTFVDITEARTAKDKLAVSEMRYRTLFETAQEGILILDGMSGKIKDVNPFLIKLLGYSEEKLLEKQIWDIGLLKDVVANKEIFLDLKKKKYMRYKDLPLETANGEKIAVEFISNAYEIDRIKIIQCNIRVTHDFKKSGLVEKEGTS